MVLNLRILLFFAIRPESRPSDLLQLHSSLQEPGKNGQRKRNEWLQRQMVDSGAGNVGGMGSRELQRHDSAKGFGGTGGFANNISAEESGKRNRYRGGGSDLNPDLLTEVFSHLPQKDPSEVMLVRRDWNKVVVDSSVLWREVEFFLTLDSRAMEAEGMEGSEEGVEGSEGMQEWKGRVPDVLSQLLRLAELVRFTKSIPQGEYHTLWVGGTNLTYQYIQDRTSRNITPSFFPVLLAKCHNRKSLTVDGNLENEGTPVPIRHPGLGMLRFAGYNRFALILDCPSLLELYFDSDPLFVHRCARVPRLNRPRLTSLHLSDYYSSEGVIEFKAAHSRV